jgi:hypothetical protein
MLLLPKNTKSMLRITPGTQSTVIGRAAITYTPNKAETTALMTCAGTEIVSLRVV